MAIKCGGFFTLEQEKTASVPTASVLFKSTSADKKKPHTLQAKAREPLPRTEPNIANMYRSDEQHLRKVFMNCSWVEAIKYNEI